MLGMLCQRLRQRLATAHAIAQILQQAGLRARIGKPDQQFKGTVERQPGTDQVGQIAGEADDLVAC